MSHDRFSVWHDGVEHNCTIAPTDNAEAVGELLVREGFNPVPAAVGSAKHDDIRAQTNYFAANRQRRTTICTAKACRSAVARWKAPARTWPRG